MTSTLELPPRKLKNNQQALTILRSQTSAEILVQMGFPKNRVEKALAATGDKGIQLASDWLLAHVNDPKLDDDSPREYILYLCPVGQLHQKFLNFWQNSYQECGWNRAHNYFPHMTLSSFFQAEDRLVSHLSHVLKKVTEKIEDPPEKMEFDVFTSNKYIGLFAREKHETFLKNVTSNFAEEMKKAGIEVEVHKKQLHVSMAYHFAVDKKDKLDALLSDIDLNTPARWDLRIYSRSLLEPNCQVRRIIYPYSNTAATDELDLNTRDYLFVKESDLEASDDGWCEGVSWMTGCSGMFPLVYTERTAETETWTMHKSIPIIGADLNIDTDLTGNLSNEENEAASPNLPKSILATTSTTGFATMPPSLSSQHQQLGNKSNNSTSTSMYIPNHKDVVNDNMINSSTPTTVHQTSIVSAVSIATTTSTNNVTSTITTESNQKELKVVKPPIAVFTSKNKNKVTTTSATNINVVIPTTTVSNTPISQTSSPVTSVTTISTSTKPTTTSTTTSIQQPSPPTIPTPINNNFCCDNIFPMLPIASLKGPRQLFVAKHGESIESTFGRDWIDNSFDQSGKYTRYDLNMPKFMPTRQSGHQEFKKDSPLTVQGCFQARLLGEALRDKRIRPVHIYTSPALKCIESAVHLLDGLNSQTSSSSLNNTITTKVEPGLFDWLGFYPEGLPKFMTFDELLSNGYRVDDSHVTVIPTSKLLNIVEESVDQFYERCYIVTKEILKRHENEGGIILFICHGSNLDSCTRKLIGQCKRSSQGFQEISRKVPYGAVCVVQEATVVLDTWYLIEPPVLPFAHSNNPKYNWTSLTIPSLI